ncbi:MAG: hypothetical protein GY866_20295, partial [Proteobacteria bacterium]|nr:hypothetical protein [Pseudomonadota bacterium]
EKCVRFENLLDVFAQIDTSKVNSRVLEALVKSGAFDSLEPNRKNILEGIDRILSLAQAEKSMYRENQVSFFDLLSEEEEEKSRTSALKKEGRRFQNRESVNLAGVVVARSITTLPAIRAERSASVSIDLPADIAPAETESIKNLIHHHPGNCAVSLSLVTENACRVQIGLRKKIKADERLVADLEEIVPLENLAFRYAAQAPASGQAGQEAYGPPPANGR